MKIEIDARSAGLGALLALVTVGAASPMVMRPDGLEFPDGTVQTTAAQSDSRRAFYLTRSRWDGASALTACADGYHMASLWEILDPTDLRYATEESDAETTADSGFGPPSREGGWIRTGQSSRSDQTDLNSKGDGGVVNCDAYTSSSSDADGSVVFLSDCWQDADDCGDFFGREAAPWWVAAELRCDLTQEVWCVED